jgi:putative membrane protein
MTPTRAEGRVLAGIVLIGLVWSGVAPVSRLTWLMEVAWVIVGLPLVLWGWRRFPLTRLLCWLLVLHALVLIYGGHYTYAQAPLGNWFRDAFALSRNDYDRLGHFVQGFVPAILAREILLRRTPLRPGGWLFVLVSSVCLAFSAFFEFIEWWSSLVLGAAADAYLATQGDVWDTQWDMFTCLIGAVLAQLLLSRTHDRQLATIQQPPPQADTASATRRAR